MLQHPEYTRTRLHKLADVLRKRIYAESRPIEDVRVSPPTGRISYAQAQELEYRPTKVGEQFGPTWTTFWFRLCAKVPAEWAGGRVDLLWISHSEATLWRDGVTLQGLNYDFPNPPSRVRRDAMLLKSANGGEQIDCQVEMACNQLGGWNHLVGFPGMSPFLLECCDIALFDAMAWELYYDFRFLQELEAQQAKDLDKCWAGELLSELNRFANTYDPASRDTWAPAGQILKSLYTRRNATRTHELSAIGHAHIDTAWMWPLAETRRKCERSFSTALAYMDEYPEYKFACSQAAQYEIIKKCNPDLYCRIAEKVRTGQFVPAGGTWVEPDCNMPSGESLARQFLYGQRFFRKEFGLTCKEFWQPDVFGYNGQLPQLMRQAGISRFLTQKLSWNRFNKPQHHTFTWQAIDGSEVLAHFPPSDTYNSNASVEDLRRTAQQYKDHDRSRHSYLLFGYGDGGGGPTREMIENVLRAKDLQGLPRTRVRTPDEFFALLEEDCTDRPLVIGELYFEYHRGTYTTQAAVKRDNRKNEFLLHDVEFLSAAASRAAGWTYPQAELERLWKLLLLNQFHDILPGSSFSIVYEDASRDHAEIRASGQKVADDALQALVGEGNGVVPVNTIGFARQEVAPLPDGQLAFVNAPSYGFGEIAQASDKVTVRQEGQSIVMENAHLRAQLDTDGRLLSLVLKGKDAPAAAQREALIAPANVFELYDDVPNQWDAWDVDPFHLETRKECPPATCTGIVEQGPLRVGVGFERKVGSASKLTQVVRLEADARRLEFHTTVDWQETAKFLKVAFPVAVRAMNATYEMQFGCVERPTHYNTSYDLARYEVPAHKWMDLSEHGFGVAMLNESKYGCSTYGGTMRLSLLRSPKQPDGPIADRGRHEFAYAIMPHRGSWRDAGVVAESYRFNVPLRFVAGSARPHSLLSCDDPNLVIDTVKKAEDSDALIVRLYEAHGARGDARLHCGLPFKSARFCNTLEEDVAKAESADGMIRIPYTPFKIITVKLD